MKQSINAFEYAGHICAAMKKGILLTTKSDDFVNTMTIGWGKIGIEWGRPVFIAYVRETRYTKTLLEQCGEFTVNIPMDDFDQKILGYCGTKSGREVDKIKEMGLTLEEPLSISVPGIRELPLTLECRVVYKQDQVLSALQDDLCDRYYDKTDSADYHTAYYAEIVSAYIIEDYA